MGEIKVPAQSTCVQEVLSKRPDLPHCHHVPWSSKRTDRPDPDGGLGLSRPSGPVPSPPRPAPIPSQPRPGCVQSTSPGTASPVCGVPSLPPNPAGGVPWATRTPNAQPTFHSQFSWWVASGTWPKGWAWAGPGLGVSLWPMLGSSVLKCDQCSPRPETQPDACPAPSLYTSGSQGQ